MFVPGNETHDLGVASVMFYQLRFINRLFFFCPAYSVHRSLDQSFYSNQGKQMFHQRYEVTQSFSL